MTDMMLMTAMMMLNTNTSTSKIRPLHPDINLSRKLKGALRQGCTIVHPVFILVQPRKQANAVQCKKKIFHSKRGFIYLNHTISPFFAV